MSYIQMWAENAGARNPVNGSWVQALCEVYGARYEGDAMRNIAVALNCDLRTYPNSIHAIAVKLGKTRSINGSWIQAIAISIR